MEWVDILNELKQAQRMVHDHAIVTLDETTPKCLALLSTRCKEFGNRRSVELREAHKLLWRAYLASRYERDPTDFDEWVVVIE